MRTLAKWSVNEYHDLIDKGVLDHKKVELLNGELIEMAPESPIHRYIMRRSKSYLNQLFDEVALVQEGHPITLSNSEPEPDVTIYKKPESEYRTRHPNSSDIFLVVEVSNSTLSYDLNKKKEIYADEGIQEYWVIDVQQQQLYLFKNLVEGKYCFSQIYTGGEISLEVFPTIKVAVKKLFD